MVNPILDSEDFKFQNLSNQNNQISDIPNLRILRASYKNGISYQQRLQVFLQECIGDYLLFLDLDSQSIDDALEILLRKKSADIVIGRRTTKKHSPIKWIASKIFYLLLKIFGSVKFNDEYSDFCVINRKVIHYLLAQGDVKLLYLTQFDCTFSIYALDYTPLKSNKWQLLKAFNLGIDLITADSQKLLRLSSILCVSVSVFSFAWLLYVLGAWFFNPRVQSGWASSSIFMVVMCGCLFFVLGIISEYLRVVLVRLKRDEPYQILDEQNTLTLRFSKNVKEQ